MNQNLSSVEKISNPVGFNWLAFFASSVYYAGKGRIKKGATLALLNFIPLMMIFTGIYCGKKANTELFQKNFNWGPAIGVGVLQVVWSSIIYSIFKGG